MGLFKEANNEYVDYTLLKKKGLLKESDQKSSGETIDFTSASSSAGASVPVGSAISQGNGEGNPFGFLDSMASASSGSSDSYYGTNTSNVSGAGSSDLSSSSSDINALRIKVEDLEYKIERLLEKISKVESKIGNV
ncbi:MAG: hypothetical protein AABX66_00975 [Nanoarchaeota archaeon]